MLASSGPNKKSPITQLKDLQWHMKQIFVCYSSIPQEPCKKSLFYKELTFCNKNTFCNKKKKNSVRTLNKDSTKDVRVNTVVVSGTYPRKNSQLKDIL